MKYTRKQLVAMARAVLRAKKSNDSRYNNFIITMQLLTFMSADDIEKRIHRIAKG